MKEGLEKGKVVRLVGTRKQGTIMEGPKSISGKSYYVVNIDGEAKTYEDKHLELAELKTYDIKCSFSRNDFSSLEDFRNYLTFIKVEKPLTNNLYTFLASRTEFHAYQFKPALKFLRNPFQRIFIADEVGVGKTIEAGIILTELMSRTDLNKILIVCPAALKYKWQAEMKKRFDVDFQIADGNTLKTIFMKHERGDKFRFKIIAPISLLRREEHLYQLEKLQIPIDLVIIDEAHHMRNGDTWSFALGKALSELSDAMICLSATPLHLRGEDLFNLFKILMTQYKEFENYDVFYEQIKPNEYINVALKKLSENSTPSEVLETLRKIESTSQSARFLKNPLYQEVIDALSKKQELNHQDRIKLQGKISELNTLAYIYTRTKKKDIDINSPIREPGTIKLEFTREENTYYWTVTNFFQKLYNINPDVRSSFVTMMPQRQVASCIPASIEYLEELTEKGEININEEDYIDADAEGIKGRLQLNPVALEELKEIIKISEGLRNNDTKFLKFKECIDKTLKTEGIKKVIVFSFFRRTLKYLYNKLKDDYKVAMIHGDVPFEERETILEDFSKEGGPQILLSSEVGGEGLDMQFCNCMINYDLPWNPMRIEQRIGRIDRYGQLSPKIKIFNFSVKDTIETDILLRLLQRIGVFEKYIGELEGILGEEINKLTNEVFTTELTPKQKEKKVEQVAKVIERRKQELELFDKEERAKIIGQDAYFNEQISDIKKEKRFISPEDVKNLFASFTRRYKKTKLLEEKDEVYTFKPSEEMADLFKEKLGNEERNEKLIGMLNKKEFKITFNSKTAVKHKHVEFITIRHSLIKIMVDELRKQEPKQLTKATIKTEKHPPGRYAFAIYLLDIEGLTNDIMFLPTTINLENYQINEALSEELLKILEEAESNGDELNLTQEQIEKIQQTAEEYAVRKKDQKEEELQKTNQVLVNNRLESLTQTFQIKKERIQKMIENLKQDLNEKKQKIITMRETELANLAKNYEKRKAKLENEKNLIASHKFIAGGIIDVKR